ncbi:unnamed protein product [Spirodela intermedia]|uniref:Dirigent protein n=1 Tax=Spirodela intermedia TaxID=51605 RepID=A0A7I8JZP8_SPIIN|nr:unnamed protein product [Spirodela intermedia]
MSTIARLLTILITITTTTSGRSLDYGLTQPPPPPPPPPRSSHQHIVFFMSDMLDGGTPSTEPEPNIDNQPVINNPVGTPSPEPSANLPAAGGGGESSSWVPYISDLQGLEVGVITVIDEDLREGSAVQSPFVGRARGIYVAVPGDSGSHMMAMTARFADGEPEDSLRFFGIYQSESSASHIAVIGGTGRYDGANGYATVKRINALVSSTGPAEKKLLLTVFLS